MITVRKSEKYFAKEIPLTCFKSINYPLKVIIEPTVL